MILNRLLTLSLFITAVWVATVPVSAQTTEAQYTQLLQDAGTKAEDGREALAMLTALLSRKDASDTAVDALRELVLAATPEDAVLLRYTLSNDGALVRDSDRAAKVLQAVATQDPGNANNDLAALALNPADGSGSEIDARLQSMVAATHYASDFSAIVQAAHRALSRISWPDDVTTQAMRDSGTSPAMVVAVSIAAAIAAPDFSRLVTACDQQKFEPRADACRTIARRMLGDASTMVDQIVAAAVLNAAANDAASKAEAAKVQRQVQWQSEQANRLIAAPPGANASPARVRYSQSVLERGELSAIQELFAENKVALEPAADWQPTAAQ
ncbi:MAG: hypothetical protein Q8L45_01250 [Xanthomonadaceae bacterium]|nr:hypothetical protein [Xanthomonadaceae bacterium]MDP2186885.1 hypothetical protein [Xanthomonadales bacterium]MDZ4114910.1 hypothetical protein [Xanthomonadaceae bacterium]MDZ4377472.1 hypothetical protein [Xanthomonadaceae bacterium]